MTVTYCTTKQVVEFLQMQQIVVNEAVGTGNGTNKVFYLDYANVVAGTYTIYVNSVAQTETTNYTLNKDTGRIDFVAAPGDTLAVTADYWYSPLTNSYLEATINRAEDRIDNQTGHAWRTRYSRTESGADTTSKYEYKNCNHYHYWSTGVPIYLDHRSVTTFDNTSPSPGDTLEIWSGSWEALTTGNESRSGDYWIDYQNGVIWLRRWFLFTSTDQVRVKYRYGESVVPYDIQHCAVLIAARQIITSDDRSFLVPDGASNIPLIGKVHIWDAEITTILKNRTEIRLCMM
jgi:hypothetical protein